MVHFSSSRIAWLVHVLVLTVTMFSTQPVWAQSKTVAEVIAAGKSATALVVLPSKSGFGTAFCIDSSGIFVTCAHVVGKSTKVQLVLNSGEDEQRVVEATVLRTDAQNDIAVLQASKAEKLSSLSLGNDKTLVETAQITAFGFPFGNALSVSKQTYPNMSVNVGRVTSLRKNKGRLDVIQVDAQLNPGNSGGPVLDAEGNVIGVVSSGVVGAGLNFLMPVSRVQDVLAKPVLALSPTKIPFSDRNNSSKFSINVTSFAKDVPLDIQLILGSGDSARTFPTKQDKTTYSAEATPVPSKGPPKLLINAKFSPGYIQGLAVDTAMSAGTWKGKLSDVISIVRAQSKFTLTAKSGKPQSADAITPPSISVEVGGGKIDVDFFKVESFSVDPAAPEDAIIPFKVIAKQKDSGAVLTELSGNIELTNPPKPTRPAPTENPDLPKVTIGEATPLMELSSIPAGGNAVQICIAQQHNLIIFRNAASQITVVDSTTGEQIDRHPANEKFTDLCLSPSGNILYAADYGGTNIGYGEPKKASYMHRFDLRSKKWEVREAPGIAYLVQATDDDRLLILEDDQSVDLTLNQWKPGRQEIAVLAKRGAGYHGKMKYDPRTRRLLKTTEGLSERSCRAFRITEKEISELEESGDFPEGEGSCALSPDGSNFYYGKVQLDANDLSKSRHVFPEKILSASPAFAFGEKSYFDAKTGDKIATLPFPNALFATSPDGSQIWAFNPKKETLHRFAVDK